MYKKPRKSKDKTLDVLIKSVLYFGFKNIKIKGNSVYKQKLKLSFPNSIFDPNKTDMLFFESIKNLNPKQLFSNTNLHNESLIIFNHINKDEESRTNWLNFVQSEKVTVSINMYHCGVIFIRREQQKEHFFIRI
ncbi:hypothetical protein ACFSQJ_02315 [Croceitalea marina]|uniref:Uncharacterized protein n=1 Tax=Croceitalea marina TaxID=1775166 RepID=A0ABW5MR96_9FLAO